MQDKNRKKALQAMLKAQLTLRTAQRHIQTVLAALVVEHPGKELVVDLGINLVHNLSETIQGAYRQAGVVDAYILRPYPVMKEEYEYDFTGGERGKYAGKKK